MDKKMLIVLLQVIIVFILIILIVFFIRINNMIKLEKRVSRYSIRVNNENINISLIDNIFGKYISFVKKKRKKIKKIFPTFVKRYDKYLIGTEFKAADFITHKIVIGVIFVILTIIASAIQGTVASLIRLFISFVIGFYILDIYLKIMMKINKKKIENDMLRAIIIMNNAFKSGKSTIQAVEIASNKLPKPICYEFKKIYEEMNYGLSVDTVFDRFSKRIGSPEAEYLSSSLTILNRTGGNIITVFDAIEKTLFDKMKLKEELKNSTTVSKLVVRILLLVPIIFVIIIYLLNPDYFDPFISSPIGILLLTIMIVMFIIYVYILNRIVKVEY